MSNLAHNSSHFSKEDDSCKKYAMPPGKNIQNDPMPSNCILEVHFGVITSLIYNQTQPGLSLT